ncbi:MAG: response regulator [Planctomycetota bacterium]
MAKNLSTFGIAEMLGVDAGSIANWIDQGLLRAHRTPGGHRRVAADDLVVFLLEQKMPIPPEVQATPVRILIVDDEPGITKLVAKALAEAHPEYEVLEAHDGFRAGTIVATQKPDVVILDLRMPGMDGFEVCSLIKSQDATRHVEVLAMTAHPSPENEKKILDCGARICLAKPLDMGKLLQEVDASV